MSQIAFKPESIKEYIIQKLQENKDFLFNELDLQIFVARALEKVFLKPDYIIHLEYHLPKGWNVKFDHDYERWGETPYFDIVIEKVAEKSPRFIAIELKYKLGEVKSSQFKRFGNSANEQNIVLVTNQAAQNEGRYDFWKDVKRLELLTKHFAEEVVGGISIFLTNDETYLKTEGNYKYSNFTFNERKSGFLFWNHDAGKCARPANYCPDVNKNTIKNCGHVPIPDKCERCGEQFKKGKIVRPNFTLKNEYIGEWQNGEYLYECLDQKFYCYSVTVNK
jgi:hypothetical protein